MTVGFSARNVFFKFIDLLFKLTYFINIHAAITQFAFQPTLHIFAVLCSVVFRLTHVAIKLRYTCFTVSNKLLPMEFVFGFRFALLIFDFVTTKLKLRLRLLLRLLIRFKLSFGFLLTCRKRLLIFAKYRIAVLLCTFTACFGTFNGVVFLGNHKLGVAHIFVRFRQALFAFVLRSKGSGLTNFSFLQLLLKRLLGKGIVWGIKFSKC